MSPKAFGLLVLIIIACIVSPGFAAIIGGAISFVFQVFAVCILTFGLASLLSSLLFGKLSIKTNARTYQY